MPKVPGQRRRLVDEGGLLARHPLVERLVGARLADRVVLEEDEALEVDLLDADLGRHPHEGRQLGDRLLQAGEPGGDARAVVALALLERRNARTFFRMRSK
jgi:hypothetical protein